MFVAKLQFINYALKLFYLGLPTIFIHEQQEILLTILALCTKKKRITSKCVNTCNELVLTKSNNLFKY